MEISAAHREWIHIYIMEPYLQGCELIYRAWRGIDFHSIQHISLTLKERTICWIQGTLLLIPWVNLVVWIAWQTFGQPEILFSPFSPEPN